MESGGGGEGGQVVSVVLGCLESGISRWVACGGERSGGQGGVERGVAGAGQGRGGACGLDWRGDAGRGGNRVRERVYGLGYERGAHGVVVIRRRVGGGEWGRGQGGARMFACLRPRRCGGGGAGDEGLAVASVGSGAWASAVVGEAGLVRSAGMVAWRGNGAGGGGFSRIAWGGLICRVGA